MLYRHRWLGKADRWWLAYKPHDTFSENSSLVWVRQIFQKELRCDSERADHWWPCYWHTSQSMRRTKPQVFKGSVGYINGFLYQGYNDPSKITYPVGWKCSTTWDVETFQKWWNKLPINCCRSSFIPAFETRNPMGPNQNLRCAVRAVSESRELRSFKYIWGHVPYKHAIVVVILCNIHKL